MLSAIIISVVQQVAFLVYLIVSPDLTGNSLVAMHALIVGIAIFTLIASVPSFVWNLMMVKDRGAKRDIVGIVFASLDLLLAATFLIFDYVTRINELGFNVF